METAFAKTVTVEATGISADDVKAMRTATVTVEATGISADDVKAMRTADTISFHFNRSEGSTIRATKRVKNPGPFGDRERQHEIKCGTHFMGKHESGLRVATDNASCFEMIMSAEHSEHWQTVAGFLKAGDILRLHWYADAMSNGYVEDSVTNNEVARGYRLHADALYLKVTRGEKRYAFLLDVSVCPSNTARMIRRA